MKTMINTVIILKSLVIKMIMVMIIVNDNENECLNYPTYVHERVLDFSNHFATFVEI